MSSLTLPTGRKADVDKLIDIGSGDEQWDIGAGVAYDRYINSQLTVSASFNYIIQLEHTTEERIYEVGRMSKLEAVNYENNFIDENIHQQLLISAKKHGDLRERNLNIEEISFTTDSFYTKAFGGIYLLRDLAIPILIFESEETYKEAIQDTTYDVLMYHISHSEMIKKLVSYNVIELEIEEENTKKRYNRISNFLPLTLR